MSQLTHPRIPAPAHPRPSRATWIGAMLALAAVAATALVIALSDGSANDATPLSASAQPSLRVDGGPEESGVAGAVGSRVVTGPSESAVAAAIGRSPSKPQSTPAPDESRVAAAIAAR